MISFQILFTTGEKFYINGNPNDIFQTVLNNFLAQNNLINTIIKNAVVNANKINMNDTLLNNNINSGSIVLLYVDELIYDQQNINNNNSPNSFIKTVSPMNLQFPQLNNNGFSQIIQTPQNYNFNPLMNMNNYSPFMTMNNFNPFMAMNNLNPFIAMNNPLPQMNINNNPLLTKSIDFIVNGCKIPQNFLDGRGNTLEGWRIGGKSGPPENLKDYSPPIGWIGIGLNVLNLYDNQDNTWLGTSNQKGEWYIAYHGIKSLNSISGIYFNGFRKGPFQDCKNYKNTNPLSNVEYPKCGEGVYFIPDFDDAKDNTKILDYSGMKVRVIFMCRLNPQKVRIADIGFNKESWIINGDELNDPFGKKRDDEVRPYRILLYFEN